MRLLLFLWSLFYVPANIAENSGSIELTLKNITSDQGAIRLAVYDNSKDFEQEGTVVYGAVIPDFDVKEKQLLLPPLDYGDYAIAVYHDLNNNNKLDKTLVGIPKEPYAFSNNPTVKWNPPSFEQSKFKLRKAQLSLKITLQKWSDY